MQHPRKKRKGTTITTSIDSPSRPGQDGGQVSVSRDADGSIVLGINRITGIEADLWLSPQEAVKIAEAMIGMACPPANFRPTPIPCVRDGKLVSEWRD